MSLLHDGLRLDADGGELARARAHLAGGAVRAVAALALAGCGFRPLTDGADAGVPDAAIDLAEPGDGSAGAGDLAIAPCAKPYLIVNVDASMYPLVMRFQLAPFQACQPLIAGHALTPGTSAAAFIPPNAVAVTGSAGTMLIDADRDVPLWNNAVAGVGVLPYVASETLVGILLHDSFANDISTLDLYRDGSTRVMHHLFNGADEPIASVLGVVAHPLSSGRVLALTAGTTPSAATSLDPVLKVAMPVVASPSQSARLNTIAATGGSALRLAWVDVNSNGIYYADGSSSASGPLTCAGQSCTLVDVVPDPTSAGWLALCDYGNKRSILSMTAGSCTVAYDGVALPPDLIATDLSLAE